MLSNLKKWYRQQQINGYKSSIKDRINIYDIILDSLSFGDTIKEAISGHLKKLIERRQTSIFKNIDTKEIVFLTHVNDSLNKGNDFSKAVDGFVSNNEQMLLDSAKGGNLEKAIEVAKKLITDVDTLKSNIIKSMLYPLVLIAVIIGMILMFSFEIIPILTDISNIETWSQSALKFYHLSMFFQNHLLTIGIFLVLLIAVIVYALPRLTGKIRYTLDNVIPFSVYKDFNAGVFLISLSNLTSAGYTPFQSLTKLHENATPYLKTEIDIMLSRVNEAENPSTAINTHLLGEIGNDIEDRGNKGQFEAVIKKFGEKAIENIISKISKTFSVMNGLIMLFIVFFVGWGYSSFMTVSQGAAQVSGF